MASLTRVAKQPAFTPEEIKKLRARVHVLDASYASLCAEEELGLNVANSKAAVLREIETISKLISELEKKEQHVVAASALDFLDNFLNAVQFMVSSGVPIFFSNSVFTGKYLPVRGDGNCGLRAFLTALASRSGKYLPIDPPEIMEWINRLKPLMIQEVNQLISTGIIDEYNLLSIPENQFGAGATLDDYFAKFLTDGYHITNFDFLVLASMFNLQINVIRQNINGIDDIQCFVRHGNEIDLNIAEHICILQQPGHFVALIEVCEYLSFKSIDYLHNAIIMKFNG